MDYSGDDNEVSKDLPVINIYFLQSPVLCIHMSFKVASALIRCRPLVKVQAAPEGFYFSFSRTTVCASVSVQNKKHRRHTSSCYSI